VKITVVPAQVTTVEDKIMGSLGFSQMMLLVVPVFVSAALFATLPPAMGSSPYKYIIMAVIAFTCSILAIRIKGKIIAEWMVTILRYNLRPRYYLFNKNTAAFREQYDTVADAQTQTEQTKKHANRKIIPELDFTDKAMVLAAIENPAAKFRFETTRKGGLHVRLTEVED
jgi:hypothetical protein